MRLTLATLLAGGMAIAGCTPPTGQTPLPPPPPPVTPAGPLALTMIGHGDDQVGLEGEALPRFLQVLVSRDGKAVAGVPVAWHTTSGSLSAERTISSAGGVAYVQLTLDGPVGESRVTARIEGEPGVAPIEFRATTLERLSLVRDPAGDAQTGTVGEALPTPLRVRVTHHGRPRSGVPVTWSPAAGTISPSVATTDTDGYAVASWTLPTASGMVNAVARIPSGAQGVHFVATANPGPAATAEEVYFTGAYQASQTDPTIVYPANQYGFGVTARVRDQFGNLASTGPVAWTVTSGPARIRSSDDRPNELGYVGAAIDPEGVPGVAVITLAGPGQGTVATVTVALTEPRYEVFINSIYEPTSGFSSYVNRTNPAVDTIPVGATMHWHHWSEWWVFEDHGVESVGSPSFVGANLPTGGGTLSVTFTEPGTYQYRDPFTNLTGTVVVQ